MRNAVKLQANMAYSYCNLSSNKATKATYLETPGNRRSPVAMQTHRNSSQELSKEVER
jgi:hypothetical protein